MLSINISMSFPFLNVPSFFGGMVFSFCTPWGNFPPRNHFLSGSMNLLNFWLMQKTFLWFFFFSSKRIAKNKAKFNTKENVYQHFERADTTTTWYLTKFTTNKKKKKKKERTGSPSIHSAIHFALGFYFRSLMKCTYFPNLKICLRLVIDNEKVESLLWLDYTKHEILLKPFSLISNFNHFTSSPSIYLQIFINTKYSR